MADTSFTAKVTSIVSTWLNQVNKWLFYGRRPNYGTTTGSANAQVLTLETGSLYSAGNEADGDEFIFKAGFTNTAATTLQILPAAGLNTAVAVQIGGVALSGGEIQSGHVYKVIRLGSTWQLFPDGSFTPSGTGAVSTDFQTRGRLEVWVEDFGAVGNGSTDDAAAIQAALDAVHTAGGGTVRLSAKTYLIGATLTINSQVELVGQGRNSTTIKLKNSSNTDIIKTTSFATLTGANKWFVDTEGVPYGFALRDFLIDGNSANQTSGDGVKIYGKGYVVRDIIIHDVKGIGFYSECAFKGGQHDYRDLPESIIGPLWVYQSGSYNVQFKGPHDSRFTQLFAINSGSDGVRFESDGATYNGTCDVDYIHTYGNTARGFYANIAVKVNHLVCETNTQEGCFIESGARVVVGHMELYNNDALGSSTYFNLNTAGRDVQIGRMRIDNGVASAGGAKVTGQYTQITNADIKDSISNASAVALDWDAPSSLFQGEIINWNGSGATGLRTSNGAARSRMRIDAYIENCTTGWNNVNAAEGGRFNIRVANSDKNQICFTGAGPATFDPGGGTSTTVRETWDAIARNSGLSHTGTAQSGSATTIQFAATAGTTDNAYIGCIVTLTGGTGSGAVGVVTAYVGSTQTATIAALNGTAWSADATTTYSCAAMTLQTRQTSGTGTVASGTTTITLAHRLLVTSITPSVRNIKMTASKYSSAAKMFVSAVDKETFTVSVDADPGAGTATFGWEANLDA